ncbi:hypothetical protein ACXR6G_07415 [Ancylomarina sp. YFZ004]
MNTLRGQACLGKPKNAQWRVLLADWKAKMIDWMEDLAQGWHRLNDYRLLLSS